MVEARIGVKEPMAARRLQRVVPREVYKGQHHTSHLDTLPGEATVVDLLSNANWDRYNCLSLHLLRVETGHLQKRTYYPLAVGSSRTLEYCSHSLGLQKMVAQNRLCSTMDCYNRLKVDIKPVQQLVRDVGC